jgi:non-ribosomal peptide synthetase component F
MGVLIGEVATLYEAYRGGGESPLPELGIQYGDFAVWQREWLQGAVLEQQLSYWRRQLAELPVLELPTERARPAVQSYRGAHHSFLLPPELAEKLKELSQQAGVTLYMTLLAAFQVLLSRYTGQEDIAIGSVIAGRNRSETEDLIGLFLNTLVLRTDLSGEPSFVELLGRVREVCLGAYAHQDVPFEKLVEELQPERDFDRLPMVQVTFGLQNAPSEGLRLKGLSLRNVDFEMDVARLDLTLWMRETPEGLAGHWTYSTKLFDEARIRRMENHFWKLLESIVAGPNKSLADLEIFTDSEKAEQQANERQYEEAALQTLLSTKRKTVVLSQ